MKRIVGNSQTNREHPIASIERPRERDVSNHRPYLRQFREKHMDIAAYVVMSYFRPMNAGLLYFVDDSVDRNTDVRLDEAALAKLQRADDARHLVMRRGRVKAERDKPLRIAWQR